MQKILFTDCDDTLLTTDKKICEKNRNAIDKMLEQGHKIVLASGRSLPGTLSQAEALGLTFPGCFLIAFNGGEIYDIYHQKTVHKSRLSMNLVKDIFTLMEQESIHAQTYDEVHVLAHREHPYLKRYCETLRQEYKVVDSVTDYMTDEPSKILLVNYDDHEILEKMQSILLELYGDQIDAFFSCNAFLEIVPKGTNKGSGIRILSEYLGIPMSCTVAAGDAMNDLPMIEAAAVGAAVANADPRVKAVADYVTELDHNEGAVAEIIEKFILE